MPPQDGAWIEKNVKRVLGNGLINQQFDGEWTCGQPKENLLQPFPPQNGSQGQCASFSNGRQDLHKDNTNVSTKQTQRLW